MAELVKIVEPSGKTYEKKGENESLEFLVNTLQKIDDRLTKIENAFNSIEEEV